MIKLEVTTHSGDTDIIETESYDAEEVTEKRNNDSLQSIAIGDCSYSRIDIKNIRPINEFNENE